MTSKNNRASYLYYIKLCASFQSHWWIQTAVTILKCPIRVTISQFLSCVTFKFDGWPWKAIRHLSYTTWSFVRHFKAISEFKLELQSGNAQFGSNRRFFSRMTSNFDGWTWKKGISSIYIYASLLYQVLCITSKSLVNSNWSFSPDTLNAGQNRRFSVPCDLENWWMTLKNNRTSLLCYFKLCALFHSHLWIETRVTVQKRSI